MTQPEHIRERWSFYIDVEGFRSFLDDDKMKAVRSLGELMRAIFRVGRNCYPDEMERICAHQFGDGFIVIGDHHEESLDRCVAIATAIMRHVAAHGAYTKAASTKASWPTCRAGIRMRSWRHGSPAIASRSTWD